MILSRNIWTTKDVQDIIKRVKAIIKEEFITGEYSTDGESYRKQFAVPLQELLQACDDYLELWGDPDQRQGDASSTNTYLID